MSAIWKFPLELVDTQTVRMPFGAKILSVQAQYNVPTLWALVEESNMPEAVEVYIVGTGNPCHVSADRFVGTVQTHHGSLVWHVFV